MSAFFRDYYFTLDCSVVLVQVLVYARGIEVHRLGIAYLDDNIMEIGFALNITDDTTKFKSLFDFVEKTVQDFVKDKDYGTSLSVIYIGWICVSAKYEHFFKLRKPKFYENEEKIVDGRKSLLVKLLECEIKLGYDKLINKTDYEIKQLILNELFGCLIPAIKNSKKIKDFNLERFSEDLKSITL